MDAAPQDDPAVDPVVDPAVAPADDPGVTVVDAIGKACPMPVIDLATAVKHSPTGTVFHLLADDGAARVDVAIWCRMQRQRLDDIVDEPDHLRFVVTKTSAT